MHDISLGQTIRDYLTGEEIESTTYEDLRQALARMLVEEKGYPKGSLIPRAPVTFPVEGREYTRLVDLAALDDEDRPLIIYIFCSGVVTTYERETLAAARLFPNGPAPLAAATDTKEASLLAVKDGERLGQGMAALPDWNKVLELAAKHPSPPLDATRRDREQRILYCYSESLYDCCSEAACTISERGGRFSEDTELP